MSLISRGLESASSFFRPALDMIRRRMFGANNERLDFIMDSFYKLSARQQSVAMIGFFGGLAVVVVLAFGVYFRRITALEHELNAGYEALREIRTQVKEYKVAKARIEWLSQNVKSKTADFRAKVHFEKVAERVGVSIEGLRSEDAELPKDSQMSKYFKEERVSVRLPKVSIPRMLKFMSEIEKSDRNLTIRDLNIRGLYGDRLYFDVEAVVVGFKPI